MHVEGKAHVLILVLHLVIHTDLIKDLTREGDCELGAEILREVTGRQEENPSQTEQRERVRHRTWFSVVTVLPEKGCAAENTLGDKTENVDESLITAFLS